MITNWKDEIRKNQKENTGRYIRRWNLTRLMAERRLDPQQVADLYPCSEEFIRQLLRGDSPIGNKPLKKLVEVLKVPENEFFHLPPELGSPELDDIITKVLAVAQRKDHINTLNDTLDLILEALDQRKGPDVLKHLRGQVELLREIFRK